MSLRVAFIVPYPLDRSPGQRFRFEQWWRLLPADRLEAKVYPLFDPATYARLYSAGGVGAKSYATLKALAQRLTDVVAAQKADVVFLYRETFPLGPPLLDTYLERRIPVVYDFDDAIFLGSTSEANSIVAKLKMPQKVDRIIAGAAINTVGNAYLASYARRFSSSVRVLPTTIDVERYRPSRKRTNGDLVRIGWSGSRTTSAHLRTISDVLARVVSELPVELFIIGDPEFRLATSERVTVMPWDPRTEIQVISSLDIGLMPLPDDAWSRGKCGLKALQYMALEVPPIVSAVGVNTDIVADQENGLVVRTEDEWTQAIRLLVEQASLRRQLGRNARETVVQRYSGQQWSKSFLATLEEAASGRA
jgi:glycosyltransferase involved in cell wall biosynthesis